MLLEGFRVLELTNFMAGPFCGMQLADLGADVVKVEQPGVGDHGRRNPPIVGGDGAAFQSLNRGKRSLALNLKAPAGRQALLRLVERADVLIENFRPGTMADLELDEPRLRRLNPGLVYCSISGFGQTGPWREKAGLDLIAQATSGLMSITGQPGGAPVKCGVPVADLTTGLYAALSISAALVARARSGVGQHVDVSLYESALSLAVWESQLYWTTGEVSEPLGSAHRSTAPYQAFGCADGYVTIGAATPANWVGCCRVLGLTELVEDDRFATAPARKANERELAELIEAVTRTRPRAHWQAALEDAGVPCGPIARIDEVLGGEQTLAREMVAEVDHPTAGRRKLLASAIHTTPTPPRRPSPAPRLGEHSRAVLAEAGLPAPEIEALVAAGVVGVVEGRDGSTAEVTAPSP
jgi:crotonobetainyl-CoA:carnitine CoA-transferase CaiB-like acyl-CoA transferase